MVDIILPMVQLAGELHSWMAHNLPGEDEPSYNTGEQAGAVLSVLVLQAVELVETPAEVALLEYAVAVLDEYRSHVHKVKVVPTPKEVAGDAADQVRKRLEARAVAVAELAASSPAEVDPKLDQ